MPDAAGLLHIFNMFFNRGKARKKSRNIQKTVDIRFIQAGESRFCG